MVSGRFQGSVIDPFPSREPLVGTQSVAGRMRAAIHPNRGIRPRRVQMIGDDLRGDVIVLGINVQPRRSHAQSEIEGPKTAAIFGKGILVGSPTLGSQSACFTEWYAGIIAYIPVVIVDSRRPFAAQ